MKKLYLYLSLTLLAAGCQKSDINNDAPQGHQLSVQSVELVTSGEWSTRSAVPQDSTVVELADSAMMTCTIERIGEESQVVTRGTPMGSANDISTFKINLYNTGTASWSAGTAVTSAITATKSGRSFTCSPEYNWKSQTDKVTLLSYTPAANSSVNGLTETDNGSKIQYIVPNSVVDHPDLCVSTDMNIVNSNGTNHIRTFNMGHKLTAVGFAVNGWNVKITEVKIEGVSFYAKYNINSDAWEIVETLGSRTGGVNSASVSNAYDPNKTWTNATSNNGYMMMIPQTLGANAKAIITYAATGGTATGGTITAPLSGLTNGKWTAGQKVTYNIQLKMAPVSSTNELMMGGKAGYTTSNALAFGSKDPNDEYTFTWDAAWLHIHHGGAKAGDVSGGATSGWKIFAKNITSNIWFFSKENNISSSARTATVTMTGKRTGTKTFTVKQEKIPDEGWIPNVVLIAAGWPKNRLPIEGGLQVAKRGKRVTPDKTAEAEDVQMVWSHSNLIAPGSERVSSIGNAQLGTGKGNTDVLHEANMKGDNNHNLAAKHCKEMGVGWYLPSFAELKLIYDNRALLGPSYSFIEDNYNYWSSTQYNDNVYVFGFNFKSAQEKKIARLSNSERVRCVKGTPPTPTDSYIPTSVLQAEGWPSGNLPKTGLQIAGKGNVSVFGLPNSYDPPCKFSTEIEVVYLAPNLGNGKYNYWKLREKDKYKYPIGWACNHLGPDWYIPSREELQLIIKHQKKYLGASYVLSPENSPMLFYYWSSSEGSQWNCYAYQFSDGTLNYSEKRNEHSVRCVREF